MTNYKRNQTGHRTQTTYGLGGYKPLIEGKNIVEVIPDARVLAEEKEDKINQMRTACTEAIKANLGVETEQDMMITQYNALAGDYTLMRRDEIKDIIATQKTKYLARKATINSATTLAELDITNW